MLFSTVFATSEIIHHQICRKNCAFSVLIVLNLV